MSISVKFNPKDVERITGKLKKIKENCQTTKGGPIAELVLAYVNAYQATIIKAMGMVHGEDGGDPGISFMGKSEGTYWAPLSTYTMNFKMEKGLSLYIWSATGKTEKAVRVSSLHVPYRSATFFAGIDKARNPDEYEKALNTEYGGSREMPNSPKVHTDWWPSRPLFTIANDIFLANRGLIVAEVKKLMLKDVNWGSG